MSESESAKLERYFDFDFLDGLTSESIAARQSEINFVEN
jgi:hypothetical protein